MSFGIIGSTSIKGIPIRGVILQTPDPERENAILQCHTRIPSEYAQVGKEIRLKFNRYTPKIHLYTWKIIMIGHKDEDSRYLTWFSDVEGRYLGTYAPDLQG